MSAALETQYRRLVGWYPRQWREHHAQVIIGTLMDAAESEGRKRPTTREMLSLVGHGLGTRLDMRSGTILAVSGLAAAILAGLLQLFLIPEVGTQWPGAIALTLQLLVAPALIAAAVASLLRELTVLGAVAALAVAALAVATSASGLALAMLWSSAFAAADAGVAALVDDRIAMVIALVLGWVTGAAAIATGVQGILAAVGLGRFHSWAIAGPIALASMPLIAVSLLSPTLGVMSGIGVLSLLLVELARRKPTHAIPPRPSIVTAPSASGSERMAIGALAWAGFTLGATSVAFALTGAVWPGVSLDGTQSMQLGIAGGFLSASLVVIALTSLAATRRPGSGTRLAIPFSISLLGLGIAAVTSLPLFDAASPIRWAGLLATVLCGAVLVSVITSRLIRGSRGLRSGMAVAVGAAYTVTFGIVVTFATAFLAPVAALILAIWASREPRLRVQGAIA